MTTIEDLLLQELADAEAEIATPLSGRWHRKQISKGGKANG